MVRVELICCHLRLFLPMHMNFFLPMYMFFVPQGSHRLEKYLNVQDCLEKSLKIIFALKST